MTCPSEAVLAAHADGELARDEAIRLQDHLGACPRCRALVGVLRAENRLLSRVLEEAAGPAPARLPAGAELVTLGLVALGAAAGMQALFAWLAALGQDTPLASLDGRSRVVGVLFETLFYLLREGAPMLTSLLTTLALAAFVLLAVLIGLSLRRRPTAASLLPFALVALAAPASALERRVARSDADSVVVRAGETVDDSLLAMGESVTVDGVVTGNLIAFSRRVTVRGTVKGDLVTGAQRVEIAGPIEGNVVSVSETVSVQGPVGKSLHSFGQHVGLGREGRVEGDVFAFASETDLDGRVGRDLLAFSGLTNLRGEVARHASAWTGRLRVEAPAKIGGNLTAHVDKPNAVFVDPQATVGGKTETRLDKARQRNRFVRPGFYLWKAIWLAAAFVTGLVAYRFFPRLFSARLADAGGLGRALGIGFLGLVAPPVAIILAGLTMVGLPLALVALGLYLAALYLSSIIAGAVLGRVLLAGTGGPGPAFALALLVGLLVVAVAGSIPYLGALLRSLVMLAGLGIGIMQIRRAYRPPAAA